VSYPNVIYPGPAWVRADPLAVSDTVDNLRTAEGVPYRGILNRKATTVFASIAFQGDLIRSIPIATLGTLPYGSHWKRVRATDTTGGGHSGVAYETILKTAAGLAFTNQPANDAVEVLSSSASDTSAVVIYGTTTATDTVVVETITLNGTTPVASVKTDWGVILGIEKLATVGTITVREASADQTITTLTPTATAKGVETVPAGTQAAFNVPPVVAASGASTKQIGLAGTNAAGTVIYDSQALTGATALEVNSGFATVTKVFTGDIETTVTVTVSDSADLMVFV
jgi:hypothetical protein